MKSRGSVMKGVSLIEILAAVAIMALFLMPVFHMLVSFSTASRQQKSEGVAANLAKEEMNWWMLIASSSYLESSAVSFQNWNFRRPTVDIEGNQFELGMKIRKHPGIDLRMVYPRFEWHDFLNGGAGYSPCKDGIEQRILASGSDVVMKIERLGDISPDRAIRVGFYDLLLRVRWKMPNENDFSQTNTRFILSRRAILP